MAVPCVSLCTSLMFLQIPACLYNSTMHSDMFFYKFSLLNTFSSEVHPRGDPGAVIWGKTK